MARPHTYDPLQIKCAFKGVELHGFKKGTFVKVSRSQDTWTMQKGADGETTRTRSRDASGTIEFTLVAGSAEAADPAPARTDDTFLPSPAV